MTTKNLCFIMLKMNPRIRNRFQNSFSFLLYLYLANNSQSHVIINLFQVRFYFKRDEYDFYIIILPDCLIDITGMVTNTFKLRLRKKMVIS